MALEHEQQYLSCKRYFYYQRLALRCYLCPQILTYFTPCLSFTFTCGTTSRVEAAHVMIARTLPNGLSHSRFSNSICSLEPHGLSREAPLLIFLESPVILAFSIIPIHFISVFNRIRVYGGLREGSRTFGPGLVMPRLVMPREFSSRGHH